jgi:hypothetical protein
MDLTPHSSPDVPEPTDRLAERLREEASANRPQFSQQLHERILNHVHDQNEADESLRTLRTHRVFRYAAAVAILATFLAVSWKVRTRRTSVPVPQNAVVKKDFGPRTNPVKPSPGALEFQIAGVLSADLLPPRIEFQTPSFNLSAVPRPNDAPSVAVADAMPSGIPERLLSGLRNPAVSASDSLKDLIPPNFRLLLPLAQPAVDRARSDSAN